VDVIDPVRGVLTIDGFELGPATRPAELARALGAGDTFHGQTIGARQYLVRARFEHDRLVQLTLVDEAPEFGTGWDDYTKAKERARRAAHDAVLVAALGPAHRVDDKHYLKEWTLPWGRVVSAHDPRGGGTDIQISYRAHA